MPKVAIQLHISTCLKTIQITFPNIMQAENVYILAVQNMLNFGIHERLTKPTFAMHFLQIRHGQLFGFHNFIF